MTCCHELANDILVFYEQRAAEMDIESMNIRPHSSTDLEADKPATHVKGKSWRCPDSPIYHRNQRVAPVVTHAVKHSLRTILLIVLFLLALLPVTALADPTRLSTFRQLTAINGNAAYLSKEHQELALKQLQELRAHPHDPQALAKQFNHSINSHLPEGTATQVDPSRYVKDEKSGLVMDRVPGVTDEQLTAMRNMLQELARSTVAYDMEQITGYHGQEPPMQINLNTTTPIYAAPRRNWSPAELDIIKEKCDELIRSKIVSPISSTDYACNPVLAMKRAPDGTWSDKRFCVNYIPINRHTELD